MGRPDQAIERGIRRTMDDMSDDELLSIVNGVDEQKLLSRALLRRPGVKA